MKLITVFIIRIYQKLSFIPQSISQTVLGTTHNCIYSPTCSEYMIQAVQKYGVLKGLSLGVARISRCRPGRSGRSDSLK